MATIAVTPVVDGAFVSTTDLNADFRSLAEINGNIDVANVAAIDRQLDYTYIQLRAVSGGLMVGGTANLDYFNNVRYVFDRQGKANVQMDSYSHGHLDVLREDRTLGTALGDAKRLTIGLQRRMSEFPRVSDAVIAAATYAKAIPGASVSFYLPYEAHVVVTWQVAWTSDAARTGNTPTTEVGQDLVPEVAAFPEPNVAIRFFFDDAEHAQACTTRESRETMFAHQIETRTGRYDEYEENGLPVHALRDRHKSRYWSGHAYVGKKGKGFHTASLRVCAAQVVRQTRVRARNIKVLYFKA
jgi:hypothetical protein